MSTQKPASLALTAAGTRASPSGRPAEDVAALRRQVLEIIDEVLADSSPATADVREQLRQHVAAHPGRPEEALLEHLSSLRPEMAGAPSPSEADPEQESSPEADQDPDTAVKHGLSRVESVLRDRMLMTAFQPVCDLLTGNVVGAEALTRFVSDGGDPADYWFAEAEDTGIGTDLEFAAFESALRAALDLPRQLYLALKLSHSACLDPRLAELIHRSPVAADRMVLGISGRIDESQATLLDAAMAPLRQAGVRLSVDHGGSYFASVHHIIRLRPEMIKLDPSLTTGLDQDVLRQELVQEEVKFAQEIGAVLTAQRIETAAELATITGLGITLGQGYHLGRPSVQPRDWAAWGKSAHPVKVHSGRGRSVRS